MAYCPANPGWERQRNSEKKKSIVPIISYPNPNRELKKKIVKKFKKLKNTIIASFQAKTGWEGSRNGENKNYRSDHFLTDP